MEPQARTEFVLCYELDGVAHEHALAEESLVIGRAKDCNLCLPFNAEVSRLHATLTRATDGWVVEDMSSRLGTYVNGEKISGSRRLRDKDVLVIGQVAIALREKKHGTETVSLDPGAKSDFLAAAKARDAAPSAKSAASADAPLSRTESARQAEPIVVPSEPQPANFYELIGVANFEADPAKIQEAAKNRLGELRAGTVPESHAERQAEVDAIARGLASLSNPEKRRAYDTQLANRLGVDVEVRGGRVVPVSQEGFGQLSIGIAVIGLVIILLWFALPWLREVLAPLLDVPG
ncbi:MAG: FHA domain-containing protein [Pirellulales bacterium]